MNNKEIANKFRELASYMELYDENTFKIRSYNNAYNTLRKIPEPLGEMSEGQLSDIDGIGKAISEKIQELNKTGTLSLLEKYKDKTPEGVSEFLKVKGLGAKKIISLWKDYDIQDLHQLKEFIASKKILDVKGFGKKTTEKIDENIDIYLRSTRELLYAEAEYLLFTLVEVLEINDIDYKLAGEIALKKNTIKSIHILADQEKMELALDSLSALHELNLNRVKDNLFTQEDFHRIQLIIEFCKVKSMAEKQYIRTEGHFAKSLYGQDWKENYSDWKESEYSDVAPEQWNLYVGDWDELELDDSELVHFNDVKGVVHAHTTYSDGINTVEEMAKASQERGYKYLTITDHSKAAFYANGLDEDRVRMQWREIDEVNEKMNDFIILKGIECDILSDGSMDFRDEFLSEFDIVIASIHSNLRMSEEKSMSRLLSAIYNPNVHMLGHMTGRLILGRHGYPVDHHRVIEACRDTGTVIEINANPRRLDIDYEYLIECQKQGVLISINPDAHSIKGIDDIRYGVISGRRGGLKKINCINTFEAGEFLEAMK